MDKTSIKKFAVWARRELIYQVNLRAECYGINKNGAAMTDAARVHGVPLDESEIKYRNALIRKIHSDGYHQTMEAAAYLWFSRFCALRFMEVNGYLPSHLRVFSDDTNAFNPQILNEAIYLGGKFKHIDINRVSSLINDREKLYQYLLIAQCNELNNVLPGMFAKIDDSIALLIPDNLLDNASIIGRMISDIPADYFRIDTEYGQIEIIGWLYQYYFSEKHEEVVDPLYGKYISAKDIPAATQVFTTDWVVRYIVDNSVGRYWIEHHPNSRLASSLAYYIPSHDTFNHKKNLKPQDVTVLDPCVGSGHFIVYAMDVLMNIYRECGYSDTEAIAEIIRHNIVGLDIDSRVAELAYFAMMMKGCQYDKDFLKRGIRPRVCCFSDIRFVNHGFVRFFCGDDDNIHSSLSIIIDAMKNALETGSLIQFSNVDLDVLEKQIDRLKALNISKYADDLSTLSKAICTARVLSEHYASVITNPPYMNKYDSVLKKYIQKNYKDYSGDLFSAFIYRCLLLCKPEGYAGLMTPNVWMFIKSYEKLRRYILSCHSITTLVQMAKGAFFRDATVDVCAFVIQCNIQDRIGVYFRLEDFQGNMDYQNLKLLEALKKPSCRYRFHVSPLAFESIPGMPIGYWVGEHILKAFYTGRALDKLASPRQGLATTDNRKYLRHWFEVDFSRIAFGLERKTAISSEFKWFPYNKGGEFRKWYGNQDYIINYYHDGECIKHDVLTKYPYLKNPDFVVKNPDTYFRPSLSWSKISSGCAAFRCFPQGFLYDVSGCSIFFKTDADMHYCAGFLNSAVCAKILEFVSPTLNYETGHIGILPIIESPLHKERVIKLVQENIRLAQIDWDMFEISWNFVRHPWIELLKTQTHALGNSRIADVCHAWERECKARFCKLKANEEEINRIFIDIYGLQDDLNPIVDDKYVSVRKADSVREIKSLISYAVGCMFGRYSLSTEGLCFAGPESGDWSDEDCKQSGGNHDSELTPGLLNNVSSCRERVSQLGIAANNIIPITDDERFADDIVCRFIDFVRIVFGEYALEENLRFIADALGGKGASRDVIRNYFMNNFYADHLKLYHKCPIYWLFASGKKNAFKCLIYMHRYQPDTIARICCDYVHELQSRYLTAISDIEMCVNNDLSGKAAKMNKQLKGLREQSDELYQYEEKLQHLADKKISIDLDDGVKVNYAKFADVLAAVK